MFLAGLLSLVLVLYTFPRSGRQLRPDLSSQHWPPLLDPVLTCPEMLCRPSQVQLPWRLRSLLSRGPQNALEQMSFPQSGAQG